MDTSVAEKFCFSARDTRDYDYYSTTIDHRFPRNETLIGDIKAKINDVQD